MTSPHESAAHRTLHASAGTPRSSAEVEHAPTGTPPRERYGLEVLGVVAVTFGGSGLQSLMSLLRSQIKYHQVGLKGLATGPLKTTDTGVPQWFDLLEHLVDILTSVAPAFLAVALLMRSPAGPGLGIGLDRLRRREVLQGAGFAAAIGIPGLGLVYLATKLGFNAQIVVTDFPAVWYRIPVLIIEAFQQGIAEEVVVAAYVLVRLRQLGWGDRRALGASAVLRGSYHLYQGYGAFVGNAVMGVIFGWWFQRTRRVWPLIIAHSIIDAVSFVGYIYLHGKVSWI